MKITKKNLLTILSSYEPNEEIELEDIVSSIKKECNTNFEKSFKGCSTSLVSAIYDRCKTTSSFDIKYQNFNIRIIVDRDESIHFIERVDGVCYTKKINDTTLDFAVQILYYATGSEWSFDDYQSIKDHLDDDDEDDDLDELITQMNDLISAIRHGNE